MSKNKQMTKSPAVLLLAWMCAAPCFAAIEPTTLEIGWGEADITPPTTKRIPLCGQYYQRLADTSNPFHSRLKFVALALKQGNEHVLMGTIDNVTVWQPFVDRVRARVKELVPEIAPERIFMGCIHTHSAPGIRPAGTPRAAEMERKQPDVWGPNEYSDFALELVAQAYVAAWRGLRPGGVCRAFGQAIKARSAAAQTFIVTKCGSAGYLPTQTSEDSVGYSGGINVGKIGHEGGYRLCDIAVERINALFK